LNARWVHSRTPHKAQLHATLTLVILDTSSGTAKRLPISAPDLEYDTGGLVQHVHSHGIRREGYS
jgi:hypothetical protein